MYEGHDIIGLVLWEKEYEGMATPDWSAVAAFAPPYSVDQRAGKGRRAEYM